MWFEVNGRMVEVCAYCGGMNGDHSPYCHTNKDYLKRMELKAEEQHKEHDKRMREAGWDTTPRKAF